jgi:hypothetical protein
MKVIPTLRAPAVVRPAASFSFIYCLILLTLLAGQGLAQTSVPGYTPPALKQKQKPSHEEKARHGAAPLSRIRPEVNIESTRAHRLSALIPAAGVNGRLKGAKPPACQWSAQPQVNWLTINSGAGDGNGAITFTAAANPATAEDNGAVPREGPIRVAPSGGSFTPTVKQNYNCGFRVGPKGITLKPSDVIYGSPLFTQLFVLRGRGDGTLTIKRDGFVSNPAPIRIGGQ